MNCEEARKISIVDWLSRSGYTANIKNGKAWYCSPLREEKTASFVVNMNNNTWYDFGNGMHGSIIDLVSHMYNAGIKEALRILGHVPTIQYHSSFNKQTTFEKSKIIINNMQPLSNRILIQYCESRKIPFKIACRYLSEAYYTVNDNNKQYFALAFKNDKNGYELRNSLFKAATTPKYITSISGVDKEQITVFEGFFDFFSYLVYFNFLIPQNDVIVLNSLSFVRESLNIITKYKKVNLFLDNDKAGQSAKETFFLYYKNVLDQSKSLFPSQKDFNEFLISK